MIQEEKESEVGNENITSYFIILRKSHFLMVRRFRMQRWKLKSLQTCIGNTFLRKHFFSKNTTLSIFLFRFFPSFFNVNNGVAFMQIIL